MERVCVNDTDSINKLIFNFSYLPTNFEAESFTKKEILLHASILLVQTSVIKRNIYRMEKTPVQKNRVAEKYLRRINQGVRA